MIDRTRALPAAYERWRSSRLGRITDLVEQDLIFRLVGPIAGSRALDVGCGDGRLAMAFARAGAEASAIDSDARMIEAARCCFDVAAVTVDLTMANARALPFEDEQFDLVTAVTVLCFARDPAPIMREMARVLRPGGRMVLGELARCSSWAAWRRVRGWLGNATWRAASFRSAVELHELAAGAGLRVQAVRAAVFYPPLGWAAIMLAPLDRWLGSRFVRGGAFLALVAVKPVAS